MTDELIDRLSADLKPMRGTTLLERLVLIVLAGLVASAILMWLWLGPRLDMADATGTAIFWIKSGYTLALGLLGVWGVERLGRPATSGSAPLLWAAACFFSIVAAAAIGYVSAPAPNHALMLMGGSASVCPYYIIALSAPLLAATLAFMRRLAPTNLPLAGAAARLATCGLGAWVYSFHCTEPGLPFLATWYSLGIAIMMVFGAVLGRFVLRW
jgi:hypothetical protein